MVTTTEDESVSDGAIPLMKREEPLELSPGAIRLFTTEELEYLFPHKKFLDELNNSATPKRLREFVLLTHIYCGYYLNALIQLLLFGFYMIERDPIPSKVMLIANSPELSMIEMGPRSQPAINAECCAALINNHNPNFAFKLNFIGTFMGADAIGASLINDLKELNANRNKVAHDPFVQQIKIKNGDHQLDDKNLESIKNFHVDLLNTMYTKYIVGQFNHVAIDANFKFRVFRVLKDKIPAGIKIVESTDFKKSGKKLLTAQSLGLGDNDEQYIYFDQRDDFFEKLLNKSARTKEDILVIEQLNLLEELNGPAAAKIGRRCLVMELFPEQYRQMSRAFWHEDSTA